MTAKYRHELKYEITMAEYLALRQRLRILCRPDSHAGPDGEYLISSLYFDNCFDKALREKRHGTDSREKFRFRYYDGDTGFIRLEKKQKRQNLCLKTSCPVSREDCQRIIDGDWDWLTQPGTSGTDGGTEGRQIPPLLQELGFKMTTQLLRPRTIVTYRREAYVYEPGNVRITFDKQVSGSLSPADYLHPAPSGTEGAAASAPLTAAAPGTMVLEVKYDEFLPDVIRRIVEPSLTRQEAISKYAACRQYEF